MTGTMTMAETALPPADNPATRPRPGWRRADRVAVAILALLAVAGAADPGGFVALIGFAAGALWRTLPILLAATAILATVKAAGVETLVGRAFRGATLPAIMLAALAGTLSPFCSCQVIPFVAALLAMGVPLAAVMAFWLSSPLMDPAMFAFTAGVLGTDFALAKAVLAVAIGTVGGVAVHLMARTPAFAQPLKADLAPRTCCGQVRNPFAGAPRADFWRDPARRAIWGRTARENVVFLGKWLALAYVIEGLMVAHVPADRIAGALGGDGLAPILAATLLGVPAYLNGYAAVPLVGGLLDRGMSPGAAMAFVMAGGMTSVPAAMAVWALVRARVFAAYILFALAGALASGLIWQALA
jgi:uncharacterized protein